MAGVIIHGQWAEDARPRFLLTVTTLSPLEQGHIVTSHTLIRGVVLRASASRCDEWGGRGVWLVFQCGIGGFPRVGNKNGA